MSLDVFPDLVLYLRPHPLDHLLSERRNSQHLFIHDSDFYPPAAEIL